MSVYCCIIVAQGTVSTWCGLDITLLELSVLHPVLPAASSAASSAVLTLLFADCPNWEPPVPAPAASSQPSLSYQHSPALSAVLLYSPADILLNILIFISWQ